MVRRAGIIFDDFGPKKNIKKRLIFGTNYMKVY